MTTNKNLFTQADKNLFMEIEDALARNNANVSANLINIAQIFAQLDQRLAAMEQNVLTITNGKVFARGPETSNDELLALIDSRVAAALARNEREHLEAMAGIARDTLSEEFRQVRDFVEAKLAQLKALLAQRPPLDPARTERPD